MTPLEFLTWAGVIVIVAAVAVLLVIAAIAGLSSVVEDWRKARRS